MIRRKQKRDAPRSKSVVHTSGTKESSYNAAPVLRVKRKPITVGAFNRHEELDGNDFDILNDTVNIEGEPSGLQIAKERPPKATFSQEDEQTATKHEDRRARSFLRRRRNDNSAASEDSDQGTMHETSLFQRKKARGENTTSRPSAFQKDDSVSAPWAKESRSNISGERENGYAGVDSVRPFQRSAQTTGTSGCEPAGRDSFKTGASNRSTAIKAPAEKGPIGSQGSRKVYTDSKSLLNLQEDGELTMLMDDLNYHMDGFNSINETVSVKTIRSNFHGLEKFCSNKDHIPVLRQSKVVCSIVNCCQVVLSREDACRDSETAKNVAKIFQVIITNTRKEVVKISREILLCLISLLKQHRNNLIERDLLFTVCMLKAACIESSALSEDLLGPDVFHLFTELGLVSMAAKMIEVAHDEQEWRLDHASDSVNSALHSLCFWTDILADTAGYSPESFSPIISSGSWICTAVQLVDLTRGLWDQDSYTADEEPKQDEQNADDWEDAFSSQQSASRHPSNEEINRCRNFSAAVCCGLIRALMNLANGNIIVCKDISVQGGVQALKGVVEHAWRLSSSEGLENDQKQLTTSSPPEQSDDKQSFSHPYNGKFEELGVTAMLALVNITELDKSSLCEVEEESFMELLVDVLAKCSERIFNVIKRSLSESQNNQLQIGLDGSKDEAFFKTLLSSSNEGLMVEVKYEGSAAVLLSMVYLRSHRLSTSFCSSEEDALEKPSGPELFRHVSKTKLIQVLRRFHKLLDMSGSSSTSTEDSLCEIIRNLEAI